MGEIYHVLPVDDYVEHTQHGTRCLCQPKAEVVEGGLIISHNAWDARELYERAEVDETLPDYLEADVEFSTKALQDSFPDERVVGFYYELSRDPYE